MPPVIPLKILQNTEQAQSDISATTHVYIYTWDPFELVDVLVFVIVSAFVSPWFPTELWSLPEVEDEGPDVSV